MNGPPSREEIDAKLESARMSSEAFFARLDTRCTRMEIAFEARCRGIEGAMTARMDAMAAALDTGQESGSRMARLDGERAERHAAPARPSR